MDRFILNYYGNKYLETKKYLKEEIETMNYNYVVEPFGGIFGFSRAYSILNKNSKTKFIINDINKELIDFYKELQKDFDKTLNKYEKIINDLIDKKLEQKEYKKIIDKNSIISYLTMGIRGMIDFSKTKQKFKNFRDKKEEYINFLKRCEFYNMDAFNFINKIKNKKNSLIYIDPPYMDSHNTEYKKTDISRKDEYHDDTTQYIKIYDLFKTNLNCLFVMNKIDIINYIYKDYIYKEYKGKYQNSKNIKYHIVYKNF